MIQIPKPKKEDVLDTDLLKKAQAEADAAIAHYIGEIKRCNQAIRDKIEADELTLLVEDLKFHFDSKDTDTQQAIDVAIDRINTTQKGDQAAGHIQEYATLYPQLKQVQSNIKKLARKLKKQNANLDLLRRAEIQVEGLGLKLKAYGKFSFYKNDTLVSELQRNFFLKCAYCESSFVHVSPADIEHFRPKSAVKIDEKTGKEKVLELKPGYYWLAADWDNLLLSCIDCNRRRNQDDIDGDGETASGKATIFPLADETDRVRDHDTWDDMIAKVRQEEKSRLLLNPCVDDPAEHLKFEMRYDEEGRVQGVFAVALNDSQKGQKSINVYGLNRAGLVWARTREALNLQNDFFALIVSIKGFLRMRKMEGELKVLQQELGHVANPSVQKRLKKLTHELITDAEENQQKSMQDIETAISLILEKLQADQPYLAMKRDLIQHDIKEWAPMKEMLDKGLMKDEHLLQILDKVKPSALKAALAREDESPT
ncbi:MAG: hypothetical protein HRU41_06760 [Saprospiraceae bacterium]|nr:hypothetical protein [Saprospiraceae bacterium]